MTSCVDRVEKARHSPGFFVHGCGVPGRVGFHIRQAPDATARDLAAQGYDTSYVFLPGLEIAAGFALHRVFVAEIASPGFVAATPNLLPSSRRKPGSNFGFRRPFVRGRPAKRAPACAGRWDRWPPTFGLPVASAHAALARHSAKAGSFGKANVRPSMDVPPDPAVGSRKNRDA
jgi:hypothetical protein